MSSGGDGVLDVKPLVEVARSADSGTPFISRRFKADPRLKIDDCVAIHDTQFITCVLCGGLILDKADANLEHPLPRWLQKFAGDLGNQEAPAFAVPGISPTWRSLSLYSHRFCNQQFGSKIESPVIATVKSIVDGGNVNWTDLDRLFDWLDKVKSSTALMAAAIRRHTLRLEYDEVAFPNLRVGAFDRAAIFFRVDNNKRDLDLWDIMGESFLSTPSSFVLCIKDLVIVYVSSNYLLSTTFGLGQVGMRDGLVSCTLGNGVLAEGFGTRISRLPMGKIIAQPMRRQHMKQFSESNGALQANGDGRVYGLEKKEWKKISCCDFSTLPKLKSAIGYILAQLECVEWNIFCKEKDFARYQAGDHFFMRSLPTLLGVKGDLLNMLSSARGGLVAPENDRI